MRAGFTSTTSPLIGANSSETAFTDSIDPNDSPAVDLAPGVGQFDEDDVAELILREVGDADLGDLAAERESTRGPWCISGLPDTTCECPL